MRLIDADRFKSYIDCGHLRPSTEVCFSELDVCNMIDKQPTIETVQGVGRYEKAMQKLQEMPKYLNGIKVKQIKKISAEVVQGEWIDEDGNKVPLDKDGCPLGSCWCNQCHEWLVGSDEYAIKGNFCPNCGVRMYKGGDSE